MNVLECNKKIPKNANIRTDSFSEIFESFSPDQLKLLMKISKSKRKISVTSFVENVSTAMAIAIKEDNKEVINFLMDSLNKI